MTALYVYVPTDPARLREMNNLVQLTSPDPSRVVERNGPTLTGRIFRWGRFRNRGVLPNRT